MLKLAKIPDNELCAACRVIKEMMKAKETLQKQRKTVREWAKENLVGRTIVVQGVQKTIEFTMNGIKETLNQPHKHMLAKNEAIRDIVSLLENSEHVLERMDDKGNPMVLNRDCRKRIVCRYQRTYGWKMPVLLHCGKTEEKG